MDPSSLHESQSQHHSQPGPAASAGPQIRSRVTVVCAECKRLKLKCDRRTPCGSCTKRDTVARCVYSPAAAEKVDLHSLNNRLIQVESQLAQFTAPGARSHNFCNHAPGPSTHVERPLLAVGQSGSSLAISLDDITAIWLDELDLSKDILPVQPSPSYPSCPSYASSSVKVESTPINLAAQDLPNSSDPPVHFLLPPLSAYYTSSPSAGETPSVTARLLAQLPFAPRRRQKLYDNVEDVLKMHPCFNFKHFKDRVEGMFKWSSEADGNDGAPSDSSSSHNGSTGVMSTKVEVARAIFFGPSGSTVTFGRTAPGQKPTLSFFASVAAAFALGTLVDREVADEEVRLEAAHGDGVSPDDPSSSRLSSRKRPEQHPILSKKSKGASKEAVCSPAVLYALSQQALSLFEKSSSYDLDFLMTMILHVLYALHDGKARVAHTLLPDVGKMVNVARTMGLNTDPDEYPGKFNLFEAESRRRLWWDVFYYDLFVSDYMGQSPLISDLEHTTRLPMDVDEEVFTPACTTIPLPRSPLSLLEPNSSDFKYFGLKCRLAQLVKDIKRRSLRDSVQDDPAAHEQFTLEQAASCANEIKQWLSDLPSTFRLDIDSDLGIAQAPQSHPSDGTNSQPSSTSVEAINVSPVLLAQRCELAVTAQRLIMKVYIPFLRPSYGHGNSTSYYQATVGTFTAAHVIIRSLRLLCLMWKQRPDLRGRRPVPALFSFYSFSRALFDAAVACAHNVIKDPNSVWVHTAVEDVNYALEVMRDPMLNTGRGPMRGGVEGGVHEAVTIIDLLLRKAECARAGNSDAASAGTKRKFDELEADVEQLRNGFRFPFVSAPVISAGSSMPPVSSDHAQSHNGARPAPARPIIHSPDLQPRKDNNASPTEEQAKRPSSVASLSSIGPKRGSDASKCKDKHAKKLPYPQTGIRVRTGKPPSPFVKPHISPSTPPLADGEQTVIPSMRQLPSITSSTPIEHPSYQPSQGSASYPQPTQITDASAYHSSSTAQNLESGSADFSLPFGAADKARAQAQMSLDMSQSRRYCQTEMDQNVSSSQQVSTVSPPVSSYERTHSVSFTGSSPASYAPSSGTYSNISSPYPTGTTQYSAPPSHDQRPSSFEMVAPTQSFYPYDAQAQAQPMSLVGVNHDTEEIFQMRDHAVSQDSGLFQYSHDKSHQGMYAPERHASVPQSPFQEQHQPMAQTWPPQTGVTSEGSSFWRPYDRFTA